LWCWYWRCRQVSSERLRANLASSERGGDMNLLETINLKKYFGDTRAVDNVSLSISEREFVSLVGPNGAGKTSLVNVISALIPSDSGKILFKGDDITQATVTDRVKAGIARSFQIVNLFDDLTAFDNVTLAIFSREGKTTNLAALAHLDHAVSAEADTVLRNFNLSDKRNERARDLSQGERKLLDVALAYALRPKLLFLDEPTSGVSTRDKGQIMDTIASVVRGEGITAVIVEHDMDVVFKYSDRIVVMQQGAILAQGTPDEIRKNDQVAMVLLGTSGPDAFTRKD
jgi:branched-chain amino acid transport system ATP-binding protein